MKIPLNLNKGLIYDLYMENKNYFVIYRKQTRQGIVIGFCSIDSNKYKNLDESRDWVVSINVQTTGESILNSLNSSGRMVDMMLRQAIKPSEFEQILNETVIPLVRSFAAQEEIEIAIRQDSIPVEVSDFWSVMLN